MITVKKLKVNTKLKVYPHKDCFCYYEANELFFVPEPKKGIIGGFFDELFDLKKGKTYEITVKEI